MTEKCHHSKKLKDPPIFFKDKDKDTITFPTWYHQITNKLKVNVDHFADDLAMMSYIENCLGGNAVRNLEPYLMQNIPSLLNEPIGDGYLKDINKMLCHLYKTYHDPNECAKALDMYNMLKLTSYAGFPMFQSTFMCLAGQVLKAKEVWKEEVHCCLLGTLQLTMMCDYLNDKVSFEDYMRLAQQMSLSLHKNGHKVQNDVPSGNAPASNNSKGCSGNPLNTLNTVGGQQANPCCNGGFEGLACAACNANMKDPVALKKLISENCCFICSSQDHCAAACPKRQTCGMSVNNIDCSTNILALACQILQHNADGDAAPADPHYAHFENPQGDDNHVKNK